MEMMVYAAGFASSTVLSLLALILSAYRDDGGDAVDDDNGGDGCIGDDDDDDGCDAETSGNQQIPQFTRFKRKLIFVAS